MRLAVSPPRSTSQAPPRQSRLRTPRRNQSTPLSSTHDSSLPGNQVNKETVPRTTDPCAIRFEVGLPKGVWPARTRFRFMFCNLQQRYHEVLIDIGETLIGISLDPRLMPHHATNALSHSAGEVAQRTVRSSASTPSLRSRDGTVPMHARMDPGGNVRVVVRVRAFLPRGLCYFFPACGERNELTFFVYFPACRASAQRRMPHPDEPPQPTNYAARPE